MLLAGQITGLLFVANCFKLTLPDFSKWKDIKDYFMDGIARGIVIPIPDTTFPSDQLEEAFRYMSRGLHTGKLLVEIRKEESDTCAIPPPMPMRVACRAYCHPLKTYIITGGLGGFGLEVAQWLVGLC